MSLRLAASIAAVGIALPAALGGQASPAAPPAPSPTGGMEIDRERGEARIPCRFVNPSRVLEVFACHNSGPAHETVVEFDIAGPALYRALLELGVRNAAYWNAMGPNDFDRNQGDRLLVLVRWEYRGERHEHPAEGILTDGPTELPMLVRGFSFGARGGRREPAPPQPAEEAPAGEGPGGIGLEVADDGPAEDDAQPPPLNDDEEAKASRETGVPRAVEISLGATVRQRPSHPLLTHPSTSRRLQPWMLPPYLDPRAVPFHQELVEKAVPATLILRRLRSEESLVDVALAEALRRGLDAQALYAAVRPIACEIDELKGRYEALIREAQAVLAGGEDVEKLKEEEKLAAAARVREIFARGRWLGAKIEERYLAWYGLEEDFKTAWIEKRADVPPEVRRDAVVLHRSGFRFEPEMARWEVQAAELDLPGAPGLPAEKSLRRQAALQEIDCLGIERDRALAGANFDAATERAREMAEKKEAYVLRLFQEESARWEIETRRHDARLTIARSQLAEVRGLLDGSWDAVKEKVLRERRRAEKMLELIEVEQHLLEATEEIRWSENDLAADDVPERQKGAAQRLEAARQKEVELKARIEALRREIAAMPGA